MSVLGGVLAFGALLVLQLPASGAPQRLEADLGSSINTIDFGVPRFTGRDSSKHLFEQVNRREIHLLEVAKWLSLEEAVYRALANNPELAAAYSEIESKTWTVTAARRRWNPSFDLTPGDYGTLQRGSSSDNTSEGGLYTYAWVEWSFFNPSVPAGINAALGDLKSQRLLFDVAARNLVLSVQTAYYKLQEQMKLYNQYQLLALLSTRLLEGAADRNGKPDAVVHELAQLRTTQRAQLGVLTNASQSLYEASYELAKLLGLPDSAMVLASDSPSSELTWSEDLQSTIAHAKQFREEVISAMELSKAEHWRSSELMASYWPRLSLIAGNTFSENETFPVYGLGINWSLDGGRNHAEAASRRIAAKTYALKAKSSQLEIAAEINKAHDNILVAALKIENATLQIDDSWRAFYGAIQLFRSKKVEATTLIQSQAQLVDAITGLESARREHNVSLAQLYRYSARWPPNVGPLLEKSLTQIQRQVAKP